MNRAIACLDILIAIICISLSVHFCPAQSSNANSKAVPWPNAEVYLQFQTIFPPGDTKLFKDSAKEIEELSCVKFIYQKLNDRPPNNINPVIIRNGAGCSSSIGSVYPHRAKLSITLSYPNCFVDSTIKHELFHTLGFNHEQTRSDAKDYLDIERSRIEKGKEGNFEADAKSINYGPFDFQSIMLYDAWSFTTHAYKPVWTVKKGQGKFDYVLHAGDFSWQDIKGLNKLYKCDSHCSNAPCKSNEYKDKHCKCISQDKFAKDRCSDKRSDCKANIENCGKDNSISSNCKKTCKLCYKSPNGVGERGSIAVCGDDTTWSGGLCTQLRNTNQQTIDQHCVQTGFSYNCRDTCQTGCITLDKFNINDRCENRRHELYCSYLSNNCQLPSFKKDCPKSCKIC